MCYNFNNQILLNFKFSSNSLQKRFSKRLFRIVSVDKQCYNKHLEILDTHLNNIQRALIFVYFVDEGNPLS